MNNPIPDKVTDKHLQQNVMAFYRKNDIYNEIPVQEGIRLFQDIFQNSQYLITEPELSKVSVDPDNLIEIYRRVDQQVMHKFGNPDEIPVTLFDEISEEITKGMTAECFCDSLRISIVQALHEILVRAENTSDAKLMADCAANLFVLRKETFSEIWPSMVICDSIVKRCIDNLYTIPDIFEKHMLVTEESVSPAMNEPGKSQSLEEIPEVAWISGLDSILNGSLVFDICQPSELEITAELMEKFDPVSLNNDDSDVPIDAFTKCLDDDIIPFMLKQITPMRIKTIQSITDLYLQDNEITEINGQFLFLLKAELTGDNPELGAVQVLWNACVAEIMKNHT